MNQTENKTKTWIKDDEGKVSSMRIMSYIALFTAIVLAVANCIPGVDGDNLHVLYFLTAAFAPKAVQKFAERKQT